MRRTAWLLLLACSGCGASDGSTFVAWPAVSADTLSFVLLRGSVQEVRGPFESDGPPEPIVVDDVEALVIEVEKASMLEVHPSVDANRLDLSELVSPAPSCVGCEDACLSPQGDRISALLPSSTRVWTRPEGGDFAVGRPELVTGLALSLPVATICERSLEVSSRRVATLGPVAQWTGLAKAWVGTLRVAGEGTWVWGPDLVFLREDGRTSRLSDVIAVDTITDFDVSPTGVHWATVLEPPMIARIGTSTAGLTIEQRFDLPSGRANAIYPLSNGGFVAAGMGGAIWTSSTGTSIEEVGLPGANSLRSISKNPLVDGELVFGASFGFLSIGNPFDGPDGFRSERILAVDRNISSLAIRDGPSGQELWAGSYGGLYHRLAPDDWRISRAVTPSSSDSCTQSPTCGFETLALQIETVTARGSQLLTTVQACPAALIIDPELECATRLDLTLGEGDLLGPSIVDGGVIVVRGGELYEIELPTVQ